MRPRNAVLTQLISIIIILLAACAPVLPANLPKDTATVLPSILPTNLPLQTKTAAPMTPQDDSITQNCVDVLPAAPANFVVQGIIPLEDYVTRRTVFLNLKTGDEVKISGAEEQVSSFSVSPDGKTLAYKIRANRSDFRLMLTNALNNHQQVIFVRKGDFSLYYWLNNQQLLLGKDAKFVIFNPYTRQEKSYSTDNFPSFDIDNIRNDWVEFDPTATKSIYKNGDIFLLDIDSKQIIAKVIDGFDRTPIAKWTVDGSEAAIVGTTAVGTSTNGTRMGDNIFGVSRDGQVNQLTHLAEHYGDGFNIHSLSWSPDSRYIAFWMWYPKAQSNDWVLAVLDMSTKQITDYCISTDPYANSLPLLQGLSAPLWSPDGKQIIVEHRTNDSKYAVLLDITRNIAFQIAQNRYPGGWMSDK